MEVVMENAERNGDGHHGCFANLSVFIGKSREKQNLGQLKPKVMERPSRQIIARTLNFSSREKINYKIFCSARDGNIMSHHRTTYEVRARPLVNLRPKRKRDVQIFGHDITSNRRAPPHVNRQNASTNLQCSQCSPNNKIDPNRLIIGKSQE